MASKSNISLTRHFTKNRRGGSIVTKSSVGSIRSKISGPVELVHTTNMLSYNAPDIVPRSASSTTTFSTKSDDDSDFTAPTPTSVSSSPPTSPDVASTDDQTRSPQPNHLSRYFTPPSAPPTKAAPAPIIPQRAPSRTSKHSEIIPRQRSISRFSNQSSQSTSTKASYTFSRSSSTSTATSHSSLMMAPPKPPPTTALPPPPVSQARHTKEVPEINPFGHELEQVTEIAEDYGVKDRLNLADAEEKEMKKLGLRKFSAEHYISEIQDLVSALFIESRPVAPMWI